jgi:prevent-host-death family protein
MSIMTVTQARAQLYKLMESVAESHKPVEITSKHGSAVLISKEDWESIQETLYLLSIPGMRESIQEGRETPLDECSEELDW